jgi:hypothetical protein
MVGKKNAIPHAKMVATAKADHSPVTELRRKSPVPVRMAEPRSIPVGENLDTNCTARSRRTTIHPLIQTLTRNPWIPTDWSTAGTHRIGPSSIEVVIAIRARNRKKRGLVRV